MSDRRSGRYLADRLRISRTVRPRTVIVVVTSISLTAAIVLSLMWFARTNGVARFDPTVGVLGLLAGIAGIVLERWVSSAERRDQALEAIANEFYFNKDLLARPPFCERVPSARWRGVYPRLNVSAVDAALSSGALVRRDDRELVQTLHQWRNQVRMFNDRLAIAETMMFLNGTEQVLRDLHEGLHDAEGPLAVLRARLAELDVLVPKVD